MNITLLSASLLLGFRHGIDIDHIAALTTLNSRKRSRDEGLKLSFFYVIGHALVVFVLGVAVIIFGLALPQSLELLFTKFVGVTLVILGVFVFRDLARFRDDFMIRSRVTLLAASVAGSIEKLSFRKSKDGLHESSTTRFPDKFGHAIHKSEGRGAVIIGMVHGIGVESPTQIALLAASSSIGGTRTGIMVLLAWILGLVSANALFAIGASYGMLKAGRSRKIYTAFGVCFASLSVGMGFCYMFGYGMLGTLTS
ncbi:MAG: high-affinity nickel permease [Candidatus Poriferisodalaceae bacterium]